MRGRFDGVQKNQFILAAAAAIIFGFGCGVIFFHQSSDAAALDSRGSSRAQEDGEDALVPKSFRVCDDRRSELIPCLDRHLIYQLDLSLMEHYERRCPPQERRYNCLISPPGGYKVPIKCPKSRDEKSDQNWMVVKG